MTMCWLRDIEMWTEEEENGGRLGQGANGGKRRKGALFADQLALPTALTGSSPLEV